MQNPSLGSGVGLDAQSVFVVPGDVQASRPLHHTHRAVSFTLFTLALVLSGIPGICDAARLGIEGKIEDVALLRRDPEAPFIDNNRDPVARWIERRGFSRAPRRGSLTSTLGMNVGRKHQQ